MSKNSPSFLMILLAVLTFSLAPVIPEMVHARADGTDRLESLSCRLTNLFGVAVLHYEKEQDKIHILTNGIHRTSIEDIRFISNDPRWTGSNTKPTSMITGTYKFGKSSYEFENYRLTFEGYFSRKGVYRVPVQFFRVRLPNPYFPVSAPDAIGTCEFELNR